MAGRQRPTGTLAAQGEALFRRLGCSGCHDPPRPDSGPELYRAQQIATALIRGAILRIRRRAIAVAGLRGP